MRRRPTRRDLLLVIGQLQDLVGRARSGYWNDRDAQRADSVVDPLTEALALCTAATSCDPNVRRGGPWDKK